MRTSKVISRSTTLPVTIYDVKEHLGIYHDEKDSNLESLMKAAVSVAEQFTGQIFRIGGDVFDQKIDSLGGKVELDWSPATGVTYVKYFDSGNTEQTLSTGSYTFLDFTTPQFVEFDSDLSVITYNRSDAATIRYTAGFSTTDNVPDDVKAAILLITQYMYDNPGDTVRQLPTASEYLLRNHKVH